MFVIVFRCNPVASARSRSVQFRAALAIRNCALVTGMCLCYCHMCFCHRRMSAEGTPCLISQQASIIQDKGYNRTSFIGGSDARIIMGTDEQALQRLWREKREELEPLEHSSNLIVQLGLVTEHLN